MQMRVILVVCRGSAVTEAGREQGVWRLVPPLDSVTLGERAETRYDPAGS